MKSIRRIKVNLRRADFDFPELVGALDRLWTRAASRVHVLLNFSTGAVRRIPAVAEYMLNQTPRTIYPVIWCALPCEHLATYRAHVESMNTMLTFADLDSVADIRKAETAVPPILPFVYRMALRSRPWTGQLEVAERLLVDEAYLFLTISRAACHASSLTDWNSMLALRKRYPERLWFFDDFLYVVFDGVRAGTPRATGMAKLFDGGEKIVLTCGRRANRQKDLDGREFAEHVAGCLGCRRKLEQVEG